MSPNLVAAIALCLTAAWVVWAVYRRRKEQQNARRELARLAQYRQAGIR